MVKIPSMQYAPTRFRSPSDSAAYNERQEQIFYDVTQLFQLANDLEAALAKTEKARDLTDRLRERHIQKLQNQVMLLEEQFRALKEGDGTHKAYVFPEQMSLDSALPETEQALIDTVHGMVHLPVASKMTSKVYLHDPVADRIIQPKSLGLQALPAEHTGRIVKDEGLYNACNGDNASYWHRQIVMAKEDNPADPVTTELIVSLPDDIISSRDVNLLYLHPFPINGVTVSKIEYRLGGDWVLLPGWPVSASTGLPVPQHNAGNLKFCFAPTGMKEIRVSMTQPDWVEENDKKVYHFGVQELGVFYADYRSQAAKVNLPVTLMGSTATRKITGITPHFKNASVLADRSVNHAKTFTYSLYVVDDLGNLKYTKDTFPILVSQNQLVVKAAIHADPVSQVTPALEYVELTYEDV